MTDYTAFAYTAKPRATNIVRFEGVYLSPKSFLLVMITSLENVKTRQIKTDVTLTVEVLNVIVKLLNENLTGVNIEQLSLEDVYSLEDKFGVYRGVLSDILRTVIDTVKGESEKEVYLDGMSNILKHPDFADISKTRSLISLLEDKEDLIRMITDQSVGHDGLNVLIGDDNLEEGLDKTSCIYHKFNIGGNVTGVLGLIGPKRMDYSGVIARLEYVVRNLIGDENSN
jgi:heat-inducible transcriptional repressor